MKAVIVGAAPLDGAECRLKNLIAESRRQDIYLIAADGGIDFFVRNSICPDIWLGDLDSANKDDNYISRVFDEFPTLKEKFCSPIKDETDIAIALEHAFANGCDEASIFGATGGKRQEHTFANIALIYHYAKMDKAVSLVSENDRIYVLVNGRKEYQVRDKGFISVFSLRDCSKNVTIKGFFYEYEGNLTNDAHIGVSNEFCGKKGVISVEDGALLIVEEHENV